MIEAIMAIICGLLLLSPIIKDHKFIERLVRSLNLFIIIIGIVALVIGILNITSVIGITLFLSGLILGIRSFSKTPAVGLYLKRVGQQLDRFRLLLGIVMVIIGVIKFISMIG